MHEQCSFWTLTYREPAPDKLDYRDFQLFLKRLRWNSRTAIRFFSCGEYGGKTGRPHWHALIFGAHPYPKGLSHIEPWPHGGVLIGDFNARTARYTCGYVMKAGARGEESFSRMSLRPGLGLDAMWNLGAEMAQHIRELSQIPPYYSIGGKKYPFDKIGRKKFYEGFEQSGGLIPKEVAKPRYQSQEVIDDRLRGDPIAQERAKFEQFWDQKLRKMKVNHGTF